MNKPENAGNIRDISAFKEVEEKKSTKAPVALCPGTARAAIGRALEYGAKVRRRPFSWREEPIKIMTLLNALGRHADAIASGEWCDPESGLPHAYHVAANAAILIDADTCGTLIDDRPPAPPSKASETQNNLREFQSSPLTEGTIH